MPWQLDKMAIPIKTLLAFRRAIFATKPAAAGGYFLLSDEKGRWPAVGGYAFDPFELDPEIPSGTYRIYFTGSQTSGVPLPSENGRPSPDFEWQNPKAPVGRNPDEEAIEAATRMAGSEGAELAVESLLNAESKAPAKSDDPAFRRYRREVEQERFARDIADNRLLLGQKMRHAGESAELLVILRSYRTELEKATRMPMALSMEFIEATKRSHTEYNAMFADLIKKNSELAKQVGELQKAQPAPPPPSLLAQIASPEGLSLARLLAELVTGKGGSSDTVGTATEEGPVLKRLKKKRDEARAKLKRLQLAAKNAAEPEQEEARSDKGATRSAKKQAGSEKVGTRSAQKPQDKKNRMKARKSTSQKNPTKPG